MVHSCRGGKSDSYDKSAVVSVSAAIQNLVWCQQAESLSETFLSALSSEFRVVAQQSGNWPTTGACLELT